MVQGIGEGLGEFLALLMVLSAVGLVAICALVGIGVWAIF